jgi:hypothetical protein
MQELEPQSPVEERHIDYLLEEEFSVNPDFLRFFLEEAHRTATEKSRIVGCTDYGNCIAVRSATTEKGETDLLVKYGIQNGSLRAAILIEDKIRAGFQPDQAKRYRDRGEEGKGREWSNYWTCLVAHSKYSADQIDFDAVVTLQTLQQYLAKRSDERSRFRVRILEQTIRKYESTGLQKIDPVMTRFRAMYASECAKSLNSEKWEYDKARDAWWDDTWFMFRGTAWPKGVKLVHQARTGCMQLILPIDESACLRRVLERSAAEHANSSALKIVVVRIGKAKSAFQIRVPKVTDFAAQPPDFEDLFAAIEFLAGFYRRYSALLPESLRIPEVEREPLPEGDTFMRALRAMLLGFMRSTVTSLGTEMPYPLPDVRHLTEAIPEAERYFASPGLMGGFLLELGEDEKGGQYILSEHWSRQWGSYSIRHKITASEVVRLDDEV